jgi:hypothetical protein
MLKIFLTAVATGLVVLAALHGAGLVTLHLKTTMYAADALGGALLGVCITLAGACPGTVAAQIGAGYRDAWFTLIGGLAGTVTFTYAEPALRPILLIGSDSLAVDQLVGVPFALGFAWLLVIGFAALERWRSWHDEIRLAGDGLKPAARVREVGVCGEARKLAS